MTSLPFFTSRRERRLWLWTLLVVAAIYSTLGVVRPLAGILREQGLLGGLFMLGMLLVGAAIFTQGLKTRPRGAEIYVALGVAAVYLLLLTRIATPEERTHLIEYGVVAVFIYEALTERANHGRRLFDLDRAGAPGRPPRDQADAAICPFDSSAASDSR